MKQGAIELELIFLIQVFSVAAVLGSTISDFLIFVLFHIPPSPASLAISAICWVVTIKLNPVWSLLWEKWTMKK
jgi:hypothetical protein